MSLLEASPPVSDTTASGRRFRRILPLAFITYSLAYLDRVNIGFGEAGSMSKSLHLTKTEFAFFNASFFIGYVLFQIPGAAYAAHRSAKRLMFWALVLWGIIASATGLLTNYRLLILDRFLLGVVALVHEEGTFNREHAADSGKPDHRRIWFDCLRLPCRLFRAAAGVWSSALATHAACGGFAYSHVGSDLVVVGR
jgi:MFS family permease